MKKLLICCLVTMGLLMSWSTGAEKTMKVLQFNVWHEGTVVEGGFDAMVDEIIRHDVDYVAISEVRNYKNTRFCDRIVEALKKKGKVYYSEFSQDSGLVSRYPIKEFTTVFPLKNDQGSMYRILTEKDGREIAVYTAHLDYRHCALYSPRGYDGSTWKKLPAKVSDVEEVLEYNRKSMRDDAIKAFIEVAKQDREKGRLVILGGDFNEPSHLDWIEKNKDMYDRNGLVIPWDCTVLLEKAGFKDCYREKYPNPLTHPGFTFPADCKHVDIKKLAWTPDVDDRDRIDYIFYAPVPWVKLNKVSMVGPKGSIEKGKRVMEKTQDPFIEPAGIWPTDHKAVLATFTIKPQKK